MIPIIPAICWAVRLDFLRMLLPIQNIIPNVRGTIIRAYNASFTLIMNSNTIKVIILIGSTNILWKLVPSATRILETSVTTIEVSSPLFLLSKKDKDKE